STENCTLASPVVPEAAETAFARLTRAHLLLVIPFWWGANLTSWRCPRTAVRYMSVSMEHLRFVVLIRLAKHPGNSSPRDLIRQAVSRSVTWLFHQMIQISLRLLVITSVLARRKQV